LVLFEPLPLSGGIGAELPFLQEIIDPEGEKRWESWVEIHPDTAASLGVHDGQRVRVSSSQGALEAEARVTPRVVSGVAAMPVGLGRRGGGRWASGCGVNPLRLLPARREAISGLPRTEGTMVEIAPAAGAGHSQDEV